MGEDKQLTKISQAELALNNANDIGEIINIRNYGKAMEVVFKAKEQKENAREAKVLQLKAQIKAGQWLDENIAHSGGFEAQYQDGTELPEGITRNESSRWQKQYRAGEDKLEEYLDKCIEYDEKENEWVETKEVSEAGFMRFITGAHVSNNSGENEWYTPEKYIDAARYVMESIDVDPASSDIANETVKATKYYTIEDDGLKQKWEGNVWMNPPYAQPLVTEFTEAFTNKWIDGEIHQGCVLVNNATETSWYQNMMKEADAICFIKGRIKFIDKNGVASGAPLQGQTVLYFGGNVEKFTNAFGEIGRVLYG